MGGHSGDLPCRRRSQSSGQITYTSAKPSRYFQHCVAAPPASVGRTKLGIPPSMAAECPNASPTGHTPLGAPLWSIEKQYRCPFADPVDTGSTPCANNASPFGFGHGQSHRAGSCAGSFCVRPRQEPPLCVVGSSDPTQHRVVDEQPLEQ